MNVRFRFALTLAAAACMTSLSVARSQTVLDQMILKDLTALGTVGGANNAHADGNVGLYQDPVVSVIGNGESAHADGNAILYDDPVPKVVGNLAPWGGHPDLWIGGQDPMVPPDRWGLRPGLNPGNPPSAPNPGREPQPNPPGPDDRDWRDWVGLGLGIWRDVNDPGCPGGWGHDDDGYLPPRPANRRPPSITWRDPGSGSSNVRAPLPKNTVPNSSVDLMLVNPSRNGADVFFEIGGRQQRLTAGEQLRLAARDRVLIQFDDGVGTQPKQYQLRGGAYQFTVDQRGWDLVRLER